VKFKYCIYLKLYIIYNIVSVQIMCYVLSRCEIQVLHIFKVIYYIQYCECTNYVLCYNSIICVNNKKIYISICNFIID
jgi:hypothetical protein